MKRTIQFGVGLLVGALLLWVLFRGTSWAEFYQALRKMDLRWFGLAMFPLAASFATRVLRWGYIVRAVNPVASYRHMFSATQIGFLANFTLPARLGEVVRAVVLARLARMPFSQCWALVVLDRVTDLIGLMATMLVALIAFRPTTDVMIPARLFGTMEDIRVPAELLRTGALSMLLLLMGILAVLVLVYAQREIALWVSDRCVGLISRRLAERIHHQIHHFAEGLSVFRSWRDIVGCVAFSLTTWGFFLLTTFAFLQAFRIAAPWYTPFVLQAGVAVFISIPGTPGFIGQFQIPVVAGLRMVDSSIDFSDALALGIVVHLVNFAAVTVLGVFCLYWEGLSLIELEKAGEESHERID